ncbi:MAG TPA: transposase [Acidimicrobiales bacterium]|nr:transposase [Acidimicrobiales bacterium]
MTLTKTTEREQPRRWHPPEVREEAVRRVLDLTAAAGGNRYGVVPRVAREVGVSPSSLRSWLRQAESTRIDVLAARVLEAEPRPVVATPPSRAPRPAGAVRRRLGAAALALRRPMAFYLASRAVVLVAVLCANATRAGLVNHRGSILWPAVPSSGGLLDGFSVWDAGWYVHIATHWYVAPPLPNSPLGGDMAFFPLFPCLVRAVSVMTGTSPLAGGWILAVFTGAAAVAAVWYATRAVAGAAVADRAAALWCLFPGAFVLSLVYAEGLTVACAGLCIVALVRRRWVAAGVAAALAGATQPVGLVLIGCCGWAAVAAVRSRRDWRAVAAPVLAPLGVAAYFGYLWARTGDPKAWFDSERMFWSQGHFGPYWTVVRPVSHFLHDPGAVWHNPGVWDNAVRVAGLAVVAALVWLVWKWRPPAVLGIWAAGAVVLALMSAPVGARPRFILVAFPLIVALARRLPRPAFYAAVALEAVLLGALTFTTVTTLNIVP